MFLQYRIFILILNISIVIGENVGLDVLKTTLLNSLPVTIYYDGVNLFTGSGGGGQEEFQGARD